MKAHALFTYHGRVECYDCLGSWCCQAAVTAEECPDSIRQTYALNEATIQEADQVKTCFFDFEMSNLSADFGQLLCGCFCHYDPGRKDGVGRVETFQLRDYKVKRWDDRSLALQLRDKLQEFDLVVSWNGIKFDIPFLNTRLERYGDREVKLSHHLDLMYTARFKLRLSNASLDNVSRYLNVDDTKTKMDPSQWVKAMGGHTASYKYIIKHCILDVKVLAQVYHKTKHLVREIK